VKKLLIFLLLSLPLHAQGTNPTAEDAQTVTGPKAFIGGITNGGCAATNGSQVVGKGTSFACQSKPVIDVRDYGNGSTNSIASAITACGTVNPCTILIPASYPTTETVPCGFLVGNGGTGCTTSSNITIIDQRTGIYNTAVNPLGYNPSNNIRPFQEWVTSYYNSLSSAPVGTNLTTLATSQKSYDGGINMFNAGTNYINKTNWAPFIHELNSYTPGQHILQTMNLNNYSVGDTLPLLMDVQCAGGFNADGDEGCEGIDEYVSQINVDYVATISSGGSSGSTSLTLSPTKGSGTQGSHRFLVDITQSITAGTVSAITGAAPPTVTGSGTSWPVSNINTILGTAVNTPEVATVTPGAMTNITTSTLLCVADSSDFEMLYPTATTGTTFTANFAKTHPSTAIVAGGGLCGYGMELAADRYAGANTLRLIYPVVRSTSSTSLGLWITAQGSYQAYAGQWSASGTNTYALYPLAEVTSVQSGGTVSNTFTLGPNAVAWANGDTVEEAHYFAMHVISGNRIYTKYFPSPSGQASLVNTAVLNGIWSGSDTWLNLQNNTTASLYSPSSGGTGVLSPPAFATLTGTWGTVLSVTGFTNRMLWNQCSTCSQNIFFQASYPTGSDYLLYIPASNLWRFQAAAANFEFQPASFTGYGATISLGTSGRPWASLFITNCLLGGASGTTSPAACGSASAGKIAIPSSAGTSYTVNTSAVTANSEIIVQQTTDNSGLPSSPTCNTSAEIPAVKQMSRSAGTSFTLSGLSNPAAITCFEYWIVN